MAAKNLLLFFLLSCIKAQVPPSSPQKFQAATGDLPFIRCSVCQRAVKHIRQGVSQLRLSATKKVDEDDILNFIEKSCNPDSKEGDWISRYDIIEKSDGLSIVDQESHSKCEQECRTVAKACEGSIGEVDTDLGELLWKDTLTLSQLSNKVCYEMTNMCKRKPPKYVKGKRKDEIFQSMSDEEKSTYDVMKQMKSMPGMPSMDMFSKEDISKMQEPNKQEKAPKEEIPNNYQSTNLGLMDTLKASFTSLFQRARKFFGYGNKKSEL